MFQDRLERLHARSRRNLALRTSNNDVAGEWLSRMGIQSEVQEDYLLLPDLEDAAVRQVGRALVGQGIDLLRLELRENSLEDIFLELTGGKAASL